jgi:hypothetical protein
MFHNDEHYITGDVYDINGKLLAKKIQLILLKYYVAEDTVKNLKRMEYSRILESSEVKSNYIEDNKTNNTSESDTVFPFGMIIVSLNENCEYGTAGNDLKK